MPTGNGGITQGLALRLTNMEQGRREVTANQFRREQMNAMNEQRKAAADYRKALAEQKEAERQQKQISELEKTINVKGLHPIYQDVARKDSAEFISRTIEGMKKVPNYTSSGEYLQDMEKVMAHQNLRLASSNNIFAGEKKVTQNSDDFELQSDMYDAMKDLNYEGFIKANGGSDYVMPDGNVQPKFNKAKVADAMWKYATLNQPIGTDVKHLDGVVTSVDVITPNEKLLEDSRNGHIQAIATSNMPDRKKIEYAEKVNEVYNELKGTARQQNKKTFKESSGDDLGMYKAKLKAKADFNAAERAAKAAEGDKVKLESNDGKTKTYTNGSVKITDSKEVNGNVITYKSIKDGIGDIKYGIPDGSTKDGSSVTGFVINPQFHILKNGKLVLVGEYKNLAGETEEGSANIVMPMNGKEGNIIANKILTNTKSTINIRFENGKYTYGFNVGEGEEAKGVKEVNNNTTPAGGGQKKAAPKASNKGNSGGQRMKWNSTTHKMEAY